MSVICALDYSRYPRGNTAPTVLPQMHCHYRGSTVHSVPSPRYYREILPIPTVITAVTAVLPHSPSPCHSLVRSVVRTVVLLTVGPVLTTAVQLQRGRGVTTASAPSHPVIRWIYLYPLHCLRFICC